MKRLRGAWRIFWSRRSRIRITLTALLLMTTVLLIAWFEAPAEWRRAVQSGIALGSGWISSLDGTTLLVALVAVSVIALIALLFVPSYRHSPYLATSPSLIPPVSVYLDAENQHPESAMKPFMEFLRSRLGGTRADLLFFQSAYDVITVQGDAAGYRKDYTTGYRALRLSGFHPIDVPHDPTGKNEISQAADNEIAIHAFERALLGPADQLFIIISQDGGFVPLIYRLVALGHRVQIWAQDPPKAYREAQRFLNVGLNVGTKEELRLDVVDLDEKIPEFASRTSKNTPLTTRRTLWPATRQGGVRSVGSSRSPLSQSRLPAAPRRKHRQLPLPATISHRGEARLYRAIMRTIEVHADVSRHPASGDIRYARFRNALGRRLKQLLSNVGYGDGSGTNMRYWLKHMSAVSVFSNAEDGEFPGSGTADAVDGAHRLFAMARAVADAAIALESVHEHGIVRMGDLANAIAEIPFDGHDLALPLASLVAIDTEKRIHVRMLVHCAQALDLVRFEDIRGRPDEISHPRLPDVQPTDLASERTSGSDQPPDAPVADTGDPPPTA